MDERAHRDIANEDDGLRPWLRWSEFDRIETLPGSELAAFLDGLAACKLIPEMAYTESADEALDYFQKHRGGVEGLWAKHEHEHLDSFVAEWSLRATVRLNETVGLTPEVIAGVETTFFSGADLMAAVEDALVLSGRFERADFDT